MLKNFYKWPPTPDRLYSEYEEIEQSEAAVSGEEREILIETLKADIGSKCRDAVCAPESEQSLCACRQLSAECGDGCDCAAECRNREFAKGDFVENLGKITRATVRGIDLCTRTNIFDLLPTEWPESDKNEFIDKIVLEKVKQRCLMRKDASLAKAIKDAKKLCASDVGFDKYKNAAIDLYRNVLKNVKKFQTHPKGTGVFVRPNCYFKNGQLISEYLGQAYPAWRWFEREKNLKALKSRLLRAKSSLPEFYNVILERHERDGGGYGVVAVDARHKGNFVSRTNHSCAPNAKMAVAAAGKRYRIGLYALRDISAGEEVTFDYFCRTDSKVRSFFVRFLFGFCVFGGKMKSGSQQCRGSFLVYSDDLSDLYIAQALPPAARVRLMLSCALSPSVKKSAARHLVALGVGRAALKNLPLWAINLAAELCRFISEEFAASPALIARKLNESRGALSADAAETAEAAKTEALFIRNRRVQSLAVAMNKLGYFLRQSGQPSAAPFEPAPRAKVIGRLWTDSDSFANRLLAAAASHLASGERRRVCGVIRSLGAVEASAAGLTRVREALAQLRDALWAVDDSPGASFTAAGDLAHLAASTTHFFTQTRYNAFKSAYFEVGAAAAGNGKAAAEHAVYDGEYPATLLLNWHRDADESFQPPRALLAAALLPDVESCFASYFSERAEVFPPYAAAARRALIERLRDGRAAGPHGPWGRETHFGFSGALGLLGSPMFDYFLQGRDKARLKRVFAEMLDAH